MNMQSHEYRRFGEEALGKAIAARLCEGAEDLPHEVGERLKAARAQAVARRKLESQPIPHLVMATASDATGQLGVDGGGWWNRIASLLPLLALIAGLISITALQDDQRASELAEVDAELLTDDLPPSAYVDPGFAQYLRAQKSH